jgi:hypothetical protein
MHRAPCPQVFLHPWFVGFQLSWAVVSTILTNRWRGKWPLPEQLLRSHLGVICPHPAVGQPATPSNPFFGIHFPLYGLFWWTLNLCQLHEAQDSSCNPSDSLFAAIDVGEKGFQKHVGTNTNDFLFGKLLGLINWTRKREKMSQSSTQLTHL